MRLIDADKLAHDLEYDVELCARALDDMNMIGKEREDTQFQKDCKQNCIWNISDQPTVEAIPIELMLKWNDAPWTDESKEIGSTVDWNIVKWLILEWRKEHEID